MDQPDALHRAIPADAGETIGPADAAGVGSPARAAGPPAAGRPGRRTGIVIVDHGSRRAESNQMLETFVEAFAVDSGYDVVEPAHMELAEPSIATAFDRCVRRGATLVVVCPYFLLPGRHWHKDIPQLAAEAAAKHPNVRYLVTAPIGLHPMMRRVIDSRIDRCLSRVAGQADACESCAQSSSGCVVRQGGGDEHAPAPSLDAEPTAARSRDD